MFDDMHWIDTVLIGLCIAALAVVFNGWIFMLLIGALHGSFGWPAVTLGFNEATGIAFLISTFVGFGCGLSGGLKK